MRASALWNAGIHRCVGCVTRRIAETLSTHAPTRTFPTASILDRSVQMVDPSTLLLKTTVPKEQSEPEWRIMLHSTTVVGAREEVYCAFVGAGLRYVNVDDGEVLLRQRSVLSTASKLEF